jgi:hypothetical protein
MPKIKSPGGVEDLPWMGGSMPEVHLGGKYGMGEGTRNRKWFPKDDPTGTGANTNIGGAKFPGGSFKKGGKVKKTGVYKLHKGEKVVTAAKAKAAAKARGAAKKPAVRKRTVSAPAARRRR